MKYLNKFDTKSDYQASASTLEIPNVAYITASTEVIYNATQPKAYVVFADQAVGRKCVLLYSSDGVGCTEADLAAVNMINASDWSGTSITSFNELRYFTGVLIISDYAFSGCTDLTGVTFSDTYLYGIGFHTFEGCTALTSVNFGTHVAVIFGHAFNGCSALERIIIPESVQQINGGAFSNCSSLSTIIFKSVTPPPSFGVSGPVFDNISSTGTLMVPSGGTSNYQSIAQSLGQGWTVEEFITFADQTVGQKCATLYGNGDVCTEADLGAVTSLNANDWRSTNQQYPTPYTSFDELRYFTAITSIPQECFGYSTSLTSVTIPSAVTEIGKRALYESPLSSITFMSTTPPTLGEEVFHDQAATGNLTVPSGSESNYFNLARSLGSGWTVNGQTPS